MGWGELTLTVGGDSLIGFGGVDKAFSSAEYREKGCPPTPKRGWSGGG